MPFPGSLITRSAPIQLADQVECGDDELIREAQANPQAFDTLYRRYVGRIYAYLYSFTYDAAEAEDLTSQTFLSAWNGLSRYRLQGTFAAWLFRIARNKAHDRHRQKHFHQALDDTRDFVTDSDPADGVEKEETFHRVAQLVGKLEPEQIELLRLHFSAGLSYSEIGSVTGHSAEATKMAFHRLFQKLRSEWKALDE